MQAIPKDIVRLAEVKSGYGQSRAAYELAKFELEQAVITAPFDGVVANLETRGFNRPDGSKPFCRVIGSGGMEVAFKVLESELPLVRRGDWWRWLRLSGQPEHAAVRCRKSTRWWTKTGW